MSKFLSGRERELKIGIVSYTENNTVLQVVGNTNITGIVTAGFFYGDGSNLTNLTGVAATVAISTTAPSSPTAGDLWYNSNKGRTFVYYDDGSSSQWVDTAPFNQAYLDALSGIGFSAGIATDPSIYYTSTPTTGIFFPASDQVTVVSAGSSILNINSSGINISGVATASSFIGDLTGNANTATYATTAGYSDIAGISTYAQGLTGTPDIIVGFITASSALFSGNVSIGGTLTYDDVTNIDSVGLITARSGIIVTGGGIDVVGVITASAFYGDGSNLSNIISGVGIQSAGTVIGTGFTTLNFIGAGNTFAVNGTTVDISISGGGSGGASVSIGTEAPTSPSAGDLWFNNNLGRTFIYYDETEVGAGSTAVWIDAAPFNYDYVSTPGKSSSTITATDGQTSFNVSYTAGYIDVFLNGIRLNSAEYIATNGTSITLLQGASAGDVLDVVEYRMGIGDTGPQGPAAALTISTRSSGVVTQNITGIAFTVSLRSGIGTVSI